MPSDLTLIIIVVVVALVALVIGTVVWTITRQVPPPAAEEIEQPTHRPQVAFVVNPIKEGTANLTELGTRACIEAGWPMPMFLQTTVEETGAQQARDAIESGADVVVAAGGDGTVRAVATGLVGSGVPMGIIPVGTGNLFARNLDLPLSSVSEALEVALFGRNRVVDVGWVEVTKAEVSATGGPPDAEWASVGDRELFLVIAGLGFDAAMVADTDASLKRWVGWLAYFFAGMKHLYGPRLQAVITVDDREPVEAQLRTVMVGNCGLLPGGLTLLPDARIDDGLFDIAAIDTRIGLAGWVQLFGEVVMQGAIEKPERSDRAWRMGQIDVAQGRRVLIGVSEGKQAQVDGDPMGKVRELSVWVDPGALVVRG